jgi:nitrogen regulatory protein PII
MATVIKKAVHTGWVSNGQVLMLSVDEVVHIRTGKHGIDTIERTKI